MKTLIRLPYILLRPLYESTSLHRRVIDEVADRQLQKAYSYCRMITRYHARTFYLATRFLPREKQRSVFAIYSLCRFLDDLADEAEDRVRNERLPASAIAEKLDNFEEKLLQVYDGSRQQEDPVLIAYADVLTRFPISVSLPLELLKGIRMDLEKTRYETFDDLYSYAFRVASVVGLMMCEVLGYEDESVLDHAVELGIAMQLTNILRDIGEDLSRGRIYLPLEELEIFGMDEEHFSSGRVDRPFVEFMKFQIERARNYYRSAEKGIPMLGRKSQLPVYLAKDNYSRILDKIEEENYRVYDRRVFLSTSEKLSVVPVHFCRLQLRKIQAL